VKAAIAYFEPVKSRNLADVTAFSFSENAQFIIVNIVRTETLESVERFLGLMTCGRLLPRDDFHTFDDYDSPKPLPYIELASEIPGKLMNNKKRKRFLI